TEYVNHLELLEVRHALEETALPDPDGAALAVRDLVPATTITDAAGRDLRLLLALPDGAAFRTDAQTLAGASPAHLDDAIYLVAPAPASGDSVALVVRLRNSLLASLLYSEVMLGDRRPGPRRLLCAGGCATRRAAIPPDLAWRALYRRRRSGGRSGGAGAALPARPPGLLPALDRPRWAQSCARYGRRGVPCRRP